jgi:broad-specificity NMP kinase
VGGWYNHLDKSAFAEVNSLKNLYIIGGTMGVGKTAVSQSLKQKLQNAVFLDGDWCWDSDPFQVNDETKKMVMHNICFMLNQFLHCSAYENVIFCWVMHEQSIIDAILASIDKTNCFTKAISLTCDPYTLRSRLEKDVCSGIRSQDVIERSLVRMPLYERLNTIKIDTSGRSVNDIANSIIAL